jgi:hydroxyacylglutathione hydrolase
MQTRCSVDRGAMHITTVPCLSDNYAFLVRSAASASAVVVDPGQADPVARAIEAAGVGLAGILNTHHHWDHTGGNEELLRRFGEVPVFAFGGERRSVPGQTVGLRDGEEFEAAGVVFRSLHVPGHTLGALAYLSGDALFTGDTLFVAGCGRLFEGTAAQMHASLSGKLASLPDTTQIFCGHEYTITNLKFAQRVEPGNEAVHRKLARVIAQRKRGEITVPSTLGEEKQTNPFLRTDSEEIRRLLSPAVAQDAPPEQVFAALRSAKDRY